MERLYVLSIRYILESLYLYSIFNVALQESELLYEVEVPGPPMCLHLSDNSGGKPMVL